MAAHVLIKRKRPAAWLLCVGGGRITGDRMLSADHPESATSTCLSCVLYTARAVVLLAILMSQRAIP